MNCIVIKFGTASITHANGEPDEAKLAAIARQVAELHNSYRIILVSSGAVGAGKSYIRNYTGSLTQRKAAAAIGNPILITKYARHFEPYGISIAQSLCERGHFANREQFLQLKDTFETLWKSRIIPIVNENDVVSDLELKFSDNDQLATLLATGFGAEALLLCTSVGGLLDKVGNIISRVEDVASSFQFVGEDKSALGLGGMSSKLTFTKLAVRMGIRVVIFGLSQENGLIDAIKGESGTEFKALRSSLSARNRWLASGGLASGRIIIDSGAFEALKKRRSLLAVGVRNIVGEFEAGEICEISVSEEAGQEVVVAVARTRISSLSFRIHYDQRNLEVANANDIVLL